MKKDRFISIIICMVIIICVVNFKPILEKYFNISGLKSFVITIIISGFLGFILYYPFNYLIEKIFRWRL